MEISIDQGNIVVCGAGGFIGGHLVSSLLARGARNVRAVDIKPLEHWYQRSCAAENLSLDLSLRGACRQALVGAQTVYNLAADMGGMGYIEYNRAACMLNVLINTHLLEAAREVQAETYFFASSACVYNISRQQEAAVTALREEDAYPAMPEDGYGWEKLFSERMCQAFAADFGLQTRIARLHNVYGPHGAYDGGREKAPAAICRKVAQAKLTGQREIEIWGTGKQTRSFMYIDDCLEGIQRLMASDVTEPINLGSNELVSIDQLLDIVENIAGIEVVRKYCPDAPTGVTGRNSDNTRILSLLGWQPNVKLKQGMERTYAWVNDCLAEKSAPQTNSTSIA